MNKEIIDKWLENEYGVSYTRLEELHDFVVEQDLKHQEQAENEINRLNNLMDKTTNYYLKTLAKNGSMPDEAVEMFNLLEGNKQ